MIKLFLHRRRHKTIGNGKIYSADIEKFSAQGRPWRYNIHFWIGPFGLHIFYCKTDDKKLVVLPDFHL